LIAVNFDVALTDLSPVRALIVVAILLCRIHGVPSVEIYVSKDTPKLVSRLIGTPPNFQIPGNSPQVVEVSGT
jgi:hypothetical protein